MAGPPGQQPRVALKLPHSSESAESLRTQRAVQEALRADARLRDFRALIPRPLAEGEHAGEYYVVEQAVHGRTALAEINDPAARTRILAAAAAAIGHLHRRTAAEVTVDAATLERWIDAPLRVILRASASTGSDLRHAAARERLRQELYDALDGKTVHVGWIHGDFWLGNLLLAPDGVSPAGIVDWDRAAAGELPWHDLFHLLLYTRGYVRRDGVADIVAMLAGTFEWAPEERAILADAHLPYDGIGERALVLLYWLRHTAATLGLVPHSDEYILENVEAVLHHM